MMLKNDHVQKRPVILIVDDDERARIILREVLEQEQFVVEEAEDGDVAVETFGSVKPDLVLLDVVMPRMDGFETCTEIRALPAGTHTPIVMMTGLDDTASINRAFEIGATSFITKPTNYTLLVNRIRYLLRAEDTADRLRDSEARLARAQSLARLGHWEWKRGSTSALCSKGLGSLLGLPETETSLSYRAFMSLVIPGDRGRVRSTAYRNLKAGRGFRIEHRVLRSDDDERIVYHEAETETDADGQLLRVTGIVQDITERRRNEEQLRYLAFFDPVTGLGNRSLLKQVFGQTMATARRYDRAFSLLFMDLDHFKRINDTLGHETGDDLLKAISRRLRQCLRSSDRMMRPDLNDEPPIGGLMGGDAVIRLGGDEFVIVLTEIQRPENASRVARRISQAVSAPVSVGGEQISVTASIGIATFPMDGSDFDTLMKKADAAMYHAKERGRNGIEYFTESLNEQSTRRLQLEAELRTAADRDSFVLRFQPRVRTKDRAMTGIEAIIFWDHSERGLIGPAEFMPVAEDLGIASAIGNWALNEAAQQIAQWRRDGVVTCPITIDVSRDLVSQSGFDHFVIETLADQDLDASCLLLEIAESVVTDGNADILATLRALNDDGIQIVLDDFGSGLASLACLRKTPFCAVKVDRSLVGGLPSDLTSDAMVRSIVALAQDLGLTTVADGVETPAQVQRLVKAGCEEIQGHEICDPLSAEDLQAWIASPVSSAKEDDRAEEVRPMRDGHLFDDAEDLPLLTACR